MSKFMKLLEQFEIAVSSFPRPSREGCQARASESSETPWHCDCAGPSVCNPTYTPKPESAAVTEARDAILDYLLPFLEEEQEDEMEQQLEALFARPCIVCSHTFSDHHNNTPGTCEWCSCTGFKL
jgi:hypothetical protein